MTGSSDKNAELSLTICVLTWILKATLQALDDEGIKDGVCIDCPAGRFRFTADTPEEHYVATALIIARSIIDAAKKTRGPDIN